MLTHTHTHTERERERERDRENAIMITLIIAEQWTCAEDNYTLLAHTGYVHPLSVYLGACTCTDILQE